MYWENMFWNPLSSLSSGQKGRKNRILKKTKGKMSLTAALSVLLKDSHISTPVSMIQN